MPQQASPALASPWGFHLPELPHDAHLSSRLLIVPWSLYKPFMLLLCKEK